jgi:hypothetical protein
MQIRLIHRTDRTRARPRLAWLTDVQFTRTTPIESPQSNGMAEAFVRTIKRDYVRVCPRPNAESVMRQRRPGSPTTTRFTPTRLSAIVHPVSSLQLTEDPDRVRSFGGYNIEGDLARRPRCVPVHESVWSGVAFCGRRRRMAL